MKNINNDQRKNELDSCECLRDRVYADIAEVLCVSVEELCAETKAGDIPEWDSFTHLLILSMLQEKYALQLSDNSAIGLNSIGKMLLALNIDSHQ